MIGVVLWSCAEKQSALFWCEDHGDLAVFEGQEIIEPKSGFFDTGDMVQFDVDICGQRRMAQNARLVTGNAFHGLAESLRLVERKASSAGRRTAEIIRLPTKNRHTAVAAAG